PMVSQMVKIGEETGELEKMLGKIADFYEDEVDAAIQSLTSIVEPLMMILVGLMVGGIVIAMYLPMVKMVSLVRYRPAPVCSTPPCALSIRSLQSRRIPRRERTP